MTRKELEENPVVIEFMELVKRLPLTDVQRVQFVKEHIERIKKEKLIGVKAKEDMFHVMTELVEEVKCIG